VDCNVKDALHGTLLSDVGFTLSREKKCVSSRAAGRRDHAMSCARAAPDRSAVRAIATFE
jgi:hypothetical protein